MELQDLISRLEILDKATSFNSKVRLDVNDAGSLMHDFEITNVHNIRPNSYATLYVTDIKGESIAEWHKRKAATAELILVLLNELPTITNALKGSQKLQQLGQVITAKIKELKRVDYASLYRSRDRAVDYLK